MIVGYITNCSKEPKEGQKRSDLFKTVEAYAESNKVKLPEVIVCDMAKRVAAESAVEGGH